MKILTPNEKFTGVSASVNFVNGAGETDDPHLIGWFKDHGYTVVAPEITQVAEPDPAVLPEPESEPGQEQVSVPSPATAKPAHKPKKT